MKKLKGALLGLAVGVALAALYLLQPAFLGEVELKALDARFRLRGPRAVPEGVVIVAADETSIDRIGRWPWPHETYARILRTISEAGALAIGLDVIWSEPERCPSDPGALPGAIGDAGNVVAGYFLREDAPAGAGAPGGPPAAASPPPNVEASALTWRQRSAEASVEMLTGRGIETNLDEIAEAARSHGYFNIQPDKDGVVRVYSLVGRYAPPGAEPRMFPSLGLAVLQVASGAQNLLVETGPAGEVSLRVDGTPLPCNEAGGLQLNWYGPGRSFTHIPAADILEGRGLDLLEGRVVLFGATELGIYDIRATPFDRVFPGVEVHATAIQNILEGTSLRRSAAENLVDLGAILLLSALTGLTIFRLRTARRGIVFSIGMAGAVFVLNLLLFSLGSLWINLTYPLLAVGVSYTAAALWRNIAVERRAREVREVFSKYVSGPVVRRLLDDPKAVRLGGEKRDMTILFSDIRGFTTLSEGLDPEVLVSFLNEFFTPMTDLVFRNQGTLDKYMGDALMAFWGAPLPDALHAANACRTAIAMREAMDTIVRTARLEQARRFTVGIGLNSGTVAVGNIGSERLHNYTVIGDAVNLASRLEGLNKIYGTRILISEFTWNAVAPRFRVRELDRVRVKGKARPVTVFELIAEEGTEPPAGEAEFLGKFSSALEAYYAGRFAEALPAFEECARLRPEDPPSGLYVNRCRMLLETPPGAAWDGVWVFQEK